MVFVKKVVVLVQFAQVPAKIQVIAVHIRDFQNGAGDLQHKDVGHGSGPGGVQTMGQVVEGTVVFQQFLIHRAGSGDLVGKPPHRDAGVVVVLDDEFFHLGQGVGPAIMHVHRDVGNLGPDDQALLVTQVIEGLGVLVVGQPDGVGAHFQNQGQVLLHHLFGDGNARPLAVLMAGNAPQRVGAAIKEEAFLRVDLKFAAAEPCGLRFAVIEAGSDGVQIRVVQTVPQTGIFQRENSLGGTVLHRSAHFLTVQGKAHPVGIHHKGLHRHLAAAGFQVGDHRSHLHRHRPVFLHSKVGGG